MTRKAKLLEPIHPGEILIEEFMKPLGISINRLSRDLHVPAKVVHSNHFRVNLEMPFASSVPRNIELASCQS